MTLGAGDLRDRVRFQKRIAASDGFGNEEAAWQDQFTRAAGLKFRAGTEAVQSARLAGRQPVSITIRSDSQSRLIETDWRAINARSGQVYNIRAVMDPEADTPRRGAWIELFCEGGVAT